MDTIGIEPGPPPKYSLSALDIQTTRRNLRRLSRVPFHWDLDSICQTPSVIPGKSYYILCCQLCRNVRSHKVTNANWFLLLSLKLHLVNFLVLTCWNSTNHLSSVRSTTAQGLLWTRIYFLTYFSILQSYCFIPALCLVLMFNRVPQ
jgi:hypothetical protein